jgi:threonine dehydratase
MLRHTQWFLRRRRFSSIGRPVVTFEDVSTATYRVREGVHQTSCNYSPFLSKVLGYELYLKKDYRQMTGSFKERGARNALMLLSSEDRKRGVVAASAGNHALALAYHGKLLNIPVTVVMPSIAPLAKIKGCQELGASVVLHGAHILEAREKADADFSDMTYINGFDHPHIIAGAGTMGMEILNQVPKADAIVIPVGGGGLIAGIALAVKTLNPMIQIIGVEPENCASFTAAMAAGKPVDTPTKPTLADGLAVPKVGANAFSVSHHLIDRMVTVSEKAIALSVLRLCELEKIVVEGGIHIQKWIIIIIIIMVAMIRRCGRLGSTH